MPNTLNYIVFLNKQIRTNKVKSIVTYQRKLEYAKERFQSIFTTQLPVNVNLLSMEDVKVTATSSIQKKTVKKIVLIMLQLAQIDILV